MAEHLCVSKLPLTMIVAATTKHGIGLNGGLPWPPLKKDMAYFARVTKRVPTAHDRSGGQRSATEDSASRQNVVIMGRKTWESIPPRFRPLQHRINVVISSHDRSTLGGMPPDVVVASDILSGLQMVGQRVRDGTANPVGRVFVIGGTSLYKAALELSQTERILLTQVGKNYACDTFFPLALDGSDGKSSWRQASLPELRAFVGEEVQEGTQTQQCDDGEVTLDFRLYVRE